MGNIAYCIDCGNKLCSENKNMRCRVCTGKLPKSKERREKISKTLTGRKMPWISVSNHQKKGVKLPPRAKDHIDKIVKENYKNGRYDPIGTIRKQGNKGYFIIKTSTILGRRNWVSYHRYLMEQKLGRKLTSKEHVHHIDGNGGNNDLSNLVLLTSSQHNTLNHLLAKLNSDNDKQFTRIIIGTLRIRYPEMF